MLLSALLSASYLQSFIIAPPELILDAGGKSEVFCATRTSRV